jgi:hypothetical protein
MRGGMRCFFHLVKGRIVLTDDTGVDVADRETALAKIVTAIRDLRSSDPDVEDHWDGWSLEIMDDRGSVLGTIVLDETGEGVSVPLQQQQNA